MALLHIERAIIGLGDWPTAHAWLVAATCDPISTGSQANLLFGAPALAFTLHGTALSGRYERTLATLDAELTTLTRRRLDHAHARIDRGEYPALAEFDLFKGLTGLGAHLLRRDPYGDLLAQILTYLIRLTEPLGSEGLPGWWAGQGPTGRRAIKMPGGHGNLSMAHGISGPLALLSLATKHGITVAGQAEAINRICVWTDAWKQEHPAGPWWPEVITLDEVRTGRVKQPRPLRPSWCYGTPGHTRAQQLAGQVTADLDRQRLAEHALLGCLNDTGQLSRIVDHSLCHGWAGLFQTTWRVAVDAHTPAFERHLRDLADRCLATGSPDATIGFLAGRAGVALALSTITTNQRSTSGWDICLLLH